MRFTIGAGGGGDSRLRVVGFNTTNVLFNVVAFTNFVILALEVVVTLFDFLYNRALFAGAFLIDAFLTSATFSYVRVVFSIVAFIDGL